MTKTDEAARAQSSSKDSLSEAPTNGVPPASSAQPGILTADKATENASLERLAASLRDRVGPGVDFLAKVEGASLFVLVLSAIGIVAILTVLPAPGGPSYQTERAIELLLTLAGTSVILALLSRNPNALTLVFGFLIIGALVVPTNDIIRFALLATGSDKSYREFVSSKSRVNSKSQLDRTKDVAMQIYQGLHDNRAISADIPIETVVSTVRTVLAREQDIQTYEGVRQRGAVELLVGLSDGKGDELVYRYGQDERFREDVEYLRQEGLISYIYDDLATIEILPPGKTLAERVRADRNPLATASVAGAAPPTIPPESEMTPLAFDANEATGFSGQANKWFLFKVPGDGEYEISASARDTADPVVSLYENNELVDFNDDISGSFNARLLRTLENDSTIYLEVDDISRTINSGIDVFVRRKPST